MADAKEAFKKITGKIQASKREIKPFANFLTDDLTANPEIVLRNIFQLFSGMMQFYAEIKPANKEKDTTTYDLTPLFVKDFAEPFFADSNLGSKLMGLSMSIKQGAQQNKIYVLEGPPGSGKSIMLNNLLSRLEAYNRLDAGQAYETVWMLDINKIGKENNPARQKELIKKVGEVFAVPCPYHDHPILQIPKAHRQELLEEIIVHEEFKKKLFTEKEYEWILTKDPCTICTSLYTALAERLNSAEDAFNMLSVRRYFFNKRLGAGISVLNAGDMLPKNFSIVNEKLQEGLNAIFNNSAEVHYTHSIYAPTNNGIYALMDVKDYNIDRFRWLHGIVSDGVHKIGVIEEKISSLFIVTANPEDLKEIKNEDSFTDRIVEVYVPYVRDYTVEMELYKNKFGQDIEKCFLPRVLENFTKLVVSSRLNEESPAIRKWIEKPKKYEKYCDKNLLLLKMELYAGKMPQWISEEDQKSFTEEITKNMLTEEKIKDGVSGRQSVDIFNLLYNQYKDAGKLVTMKMLEEFFDDNDIFLPSDEFMQSLNGLYNYYTLEEIKESIFDYNEERISKDVLNYMYALNCDFDTTHICPYTDEKITVSDAFLKSAECFIYTYALTNESLLNHLRKEQQQTFAKKTLVKEIGLEKKTIKETSQYKSMYSSYIQNVKKNVLAPFSTNDNFKFAIAEFGTDHFEAHEARIKQEVTRLINNLQKKFKYTEEGAKQVCLYVIENDIVKGS
ncbi:MAG: serine protein kinase PrkA [Nanoarchaeota archaeon]